MMLDYKNKNSKLNHKIRAVFVLFILIFNLISYSYAEEENKLGIARVKLQAVLTPPYVIGPGDQLLIIDRTLREVFGQVEQYGVTVAADGYISIPLPDGTQENILAAGYTLDELSSEIRSKFGKTLINPLVYVQISRYRPINVYIAGEIVKPGVYKLETTSTSEKGGSTSALNTFGLSVTEAIQLAGGLKPRADIRNIVLIRGASSERKTVDLKALLKGEDTSLDINLQPGDAIYIKAANDIEDQAQYNVLLLGKLAYQEVPVSVIGEAIHGGNFTLPNDSTLLDAISKAEGPNIVGSLKKIRLSRYDDKGIYRTYKINVHDLIHEGVSFDQIALRPNDTIELENSKGKEVRHFLYDISRNGFATISASLINTFGSYLIQDHLLARVSRAGMSSLSIPGIGGSGNSSGGITIFGQRAKDNND